MSSDTTPRSTPYKHALRRGGMVAVAVLLVGTLLYLPPVSTRLGPLGISGILGAIHIVLSLISVALSFFLWRHFSPGETLRTIFGCLAVGFSLWAVSVIMWSLDLAVLNTPTATLSLADLASLAGYIPVVIALYLRYRSFRITPRAPWQLAVLGGFGVVVVLSIIYVLAPIFQDTNPDSLLQQVVNGSYIVADLFVGFWALLMVLVLSGGMLSTPWLFVAFGCLAAVAGDLLYSMAERNLIYQFDPYAGIDLMGYLINLSFLAAYALVDLGLYHQARLQNVL